MTASAFPQDLDRMDPTERAVLLTAYLDDELNAREALAVTAWLDQHPEALREVEHHRRVWDLLEHYGDEPVREDFAERVLVAVDRVPGGRAVGRGETLAPASMAWYRHPLVAAAAGVLLALGGFALWGPKPSPTPDAPATVHVAQHKDNSLGALEAVPADLLLDVDALHLISTLSDEHFEAYVSGEYDDEEDAG